MRTSYLSLSLGILLAATAPTALAGELAFCPVWEDGVAIVCFSEYALTNSADGQCSSQDEFYFGWNSLFVGAGGVVGVGVNAFSGCYAGSENARWEADSVSIDAFVVDQYAGAGWNAWSDDDGHGNTYTYCELYAATPAHWQTSECVAGAPPSPTWGSVLP